MSSYAELYTDFKVSHGLTVSVENYLLINACDVAADWNGETPTLQTGFYKENSACVGFVCRGDGNNDMTLDPGNWDLSNASHFHMWYLSAIISEFNWLQVFFGDGANTGYWNAMASADYPGGWFNIVCDYTRSPDAGTQPDLSAITTIGIRINHTGTAKNAENTWFDHLYVGDGIIAYGDLDGDPFDLEDIYAVDSNDTTSGLGWGIMTKYGDVYYMVGNLTLGDSTLNSTLFQETNNILIFERRYYNVTTTQLLDSILYDLSFVGNSTRETRIQWGDKSGTAGISGCTIRANDPDRPFSITATDTDLTQIGLYATTFDTHGTIDLLPGNANYEALDCTFVNGVGQIQPNTMNFDRNKIISNSFADGAVLLESALHDMDENTYISNTYAIEVEVAGTYPIRGDQFTSNGADINNTSGGLVTINATESNVSTYTGNTVIVNTVYITITVEDQTGNSIQGARVAVYRESNDLELMNELTNASGIASEPFNYGGSPIDIYIRVRKSSSPGLRYIPYEGPGQIDDNGFSTTITLVDDDIAL